MLQAGRIVNVHLPKDRVTQSHQGYGFVEFISEEDAEYASRIMNGIRLYGKPIRVNKASADKQKAVDIGAELFVGNLDPMVNEQVLFDTFTRFGSLTSLPKVGVTISFGACVRCLYDYADHYRLHEMIIIYQKVTALYRLVISSPPMQL